MLLCLNFCRLTIVDFGWRCWLCGLEARDLDHVKPLSKGGSDFASNLRPICKRCNSRKGNRWPLPPDRHKQLVRAALARARAARLAT